jgi:ABC-type Zn uptake system ZnuABC Zn-binding protein ZnuA
MRPAPPPRWTLAAALTLAVAGAAACSGDDDRAGGDTAGRQDDTAVTVVAPNEVLAEIVREVACVGSVDVVVGASSEEATSPTAAVLALERPGGTATGDGSFLLVIPELVDTLPGADGVPDAHIWLDPIRVAELVPAITGALVVNAGLDGALLDRCAARMSALMEQLDEQIAEQIDTLSDEQRAIGVDEPGLIYFASRYQLAPSDEPVALRAESAMVVNDLGGAGSYEEMMLANARRVVEILGTG